MLGACSKGYLSRHEGVVAHTIQKACENRRPEEEQANQNPRDDGKGPLKNNPYLRRNWQLMATGREKTTYLTNTGSEGLLILQKMVLHPCT